MSDVMAEKPGFEPGRHLSHPTPLAGEPLRPLGYFRRSMEKFSWRREWDSNPRMLSHRRFSRPVLSTTQPSLRARKSMTDSNAGLILPHSVPPVNEFLNCRACFFALCRENGEKREGKDCTNRRHCAILYISRGVSTDCLYAARGQWAHAFMYNRDTPEVHSLPVLPS